MIIDDGVDAGAEVLMLDVADEIPDAVDEAHGGPSEDGRPLHWAEGANNDPDEVKEPDVPESDPFDPNNPAVKTLMITINLDTSHTKFQTNAPTNAIAMSLIVNALLAVANSVNNADNELAQIRKERDNASRIVLPGGLDARGIKTIHRGH